MNLPDFPKVPEGSAPAEVKVRTTGVKKSLVIFHPDLDTKTRNRLLLLPGDELLNVTTKDVREKPWKLSDSIRKPQFLLMTVCLPASQLAMVTGNTEYSFLNWSLIPFCYAVAAAGVYMDYLPTRKHAERHVDPSLLAGSKYVCARWLHQDNADLLARAWTAVEAISKAQVVQKDMVDSAKVKVQMPRILWDMAHTLHEVSVLRDEVGSQGIGTPQHKALAVAVEPMRARVVALETCRRQIEEADAKYAEYLHQQKLAGMDDRIMDLLARAQVADPAIEEIRDLSVQAAAAAEVFQRALGSALESVNHVLDA